MLYNSQSFRPQLSVLKHDSNSVQVILGPLEKNFAGSFANILRRIIMRFTPGVCITGFSVRGQSNVHTYKKISGIREETSNLIANIRTLILGTTSNLPIELCIKKKGPCTIRGSDIDCPSHVQVLNNDLYICTLDNDYQLNLILYADLGYGFLSASAHGNKKDVLYLDTIYSPIKHVSYYVRSYVSYEEIVLYVRTNGSCCALSAVKNALLFLNRKTTPRDL